MLLIGGVRSGEYIQYNVKGDILALTHPVDWSVPPKYNDAPSLHLDIDYYNRKAFKFEKPFPSIYWALVIDGMSEEESVKQLFILNKRGLL